MDNISSLSPRYIMAREEDRWEMFMINLIMTREIIRIDIDQTVGIEEFHLVVGYNTDEIT